MQRQLVDLQGRNLASLALAEEGSAFCCESDALASIQPRGIVPRRLPRTRARKRRFSLRGPQLLGEPGALLPVFVEDGAVTLIVAHRACVSVPLLTVHAYANETSQDRAGGVLFGRVHVFAYAAYSRFDEGDAIRALHPWVEGRVLLVHVMR